MLLEHGLPQATVIRLLRRVRPQLQRIHKENLAKDHFQSAVRRKSFAGPSQAWNDRLRKYRTSCLGVCETDGVISRRGRSWPRRVCGPILS